MTDRGEAFVLLLLIFVAVYILCSTLLPRSVDAHFFQLFRYSLEYHSIPSHSVQLT